MGLIRFILAMSVVISHGGMLFGSPATYMCGGRIAVQLFYMISGFYMAMILTRKYVGRGRVRRFLLNRVLRLYPTYFVVALGTVGVALAAGAFAGRPAPPLDAWAEHGARLPAPTALALGLVNVTLVGQDAAMFLGVDPSTGGLYPAAHYAAEPLPAYRFLLVPQAWTVGLEFLFYCLAPFLVKRSTRVLVAATLGGLALRVVVLKVLRLQGDPFDYRFFPCELPLFLFGVLAFRLYDWLERTGRFDRRLEAGVFVATVALLAGYAALPNLGDYAWTWRAFRAPAIYLFFPLAIPWLFHLTNRHRLDRFLGELSYPIYLVHWIIAITLRQGATGWLWTYRSEATCLITLAASAALYLFLERPIETVRQRLARAQ